MKKRAVLADTMPNGMGKKKLELDEKIINDIKSDDSLKTENGFSMFKVKNEVLLLGYNHFIKLKKDGIIA